mmetsp:Transcript_40618/g.60873  ORF Transcript_40618/g.60873 Transcript_40618/m.60873 type:complete len:117 (+) Transcript_40618:489-839(+)
MCFTLLVKRVILVRNYFWGERESDIFLIFYTNKYSLIFVTVVVGMVIYFFYMVESCFETCLLLVHMYILNYITRNIYQPNIPTTTTTTKLKLKCIHAYLTSPSPPPHTHTKKANNY